MFYPKNIFIHSDKNVQAAMTLGPLLSFPGPNLPNSIKLDIGKTAKFVSHINTKGDFSNLLNHLLDNEGRELYLNNLVKISEEFIKDFDCSKREIISVIFRIWSGCIAAAKGLADDSNSGSIDAKFRSQYFPSIDNLAKEDEIFAHGVRAASKYRELMGEYNNFEGVPQDSYVRADSDSSN